MPDTWVGAANVALLTDLYELTMSAAYHEQHIGGTATFELFVRRLPEQRNFLVACGIEQAVEHLLALRFDDRAVAYLDSLGLFSASFLEHLSSLRFSGELWAVPEGEVVFDQEPILQVTAPLIEAQLVETILLTDVTFQTMVASKAARIALACGDRSFVDFSSRRDHGPDAAVKAARAAFVGGASATSNVLAGQLFGLELSGTMAHSYVLAVGDERQAFRSFLRTFPDRAVLLIDTYDTVEGARRAGEVALELQDEGVRLPAVRIDSGDLLTCSIEVRKVLDDLGLDEVRIIASSDLDEYAIADLLRQGAPIDAFGVGTRLGTSADAPYLGGVYKLVADERGPKMKRSRGKLTLPGRKQVHRFDDRDVLALADEEVAGGRPLLRPVLRDGARVAEAEPLAATRERRARAVAALPADFRRLDAKCTRTVDRSPALDDLVRRLGGE